jgi:hypothetical protein
VRLHRRLRAWRLEPRAPQCLRGLRAFGRGVQLLDADDRTKVPGVAVEFGITKAFLRSAMRGDQKGAPRGARDVGSDAESRTARRPQRRADAGRGRMSVVVLSRKLCGLRPREGSRWL